MRIFKTKIIKICNENSIINANNAFNLKNVNDAYIFLYVD